MDKQEIKNKVSELVKSGRQSEAIKLLMESYQIDSPKAEAMLRGFGEVTDIINQARSFKEKIFGYVLGPLGVVILIFASYSYWSNEQAAKQSAAITGRVVELKKSEKISIDANNRDTKSETFAPVIEYVVNERSYKYESNIYGNPPLFQMDEEVPLLVDPENPSEVIINTFLGRYLVVLVAGAFGLILTVIGLYNLFFKARS